MSPVERGERFETYSGFSGYYDLLYSCTRKSKKAENIALEKASESVKRLIDYICNKNNYVIE